MKKCANCGFAETNDAKFCSKCGHDEFYEETVPRYAATHARADSRQTSVPGYNEEDMDKKPIGMAVLTFFAPYIGGYFLIRPDVNAGLRNFGIVWCALFAASMLASDVDDMSALMSIIVAALCLAPIVVYLFRKYSYEKQVREQAQAQHAEDILSLKLETFEDREVDDIARKYR